MKTPQAFLHVRIDPGNGSRESIDLINVKTNQKAMLLRDAAAQRLAQLLLRAFRPPIGKAGQLDRIGLASNPHRDHRPVALAHHIGGTDSNLMLASSNVFCTRSTWLDCSRTNCLWVRRKVRIS